MILPLPSGESITTEIARWYGRTHRAMFLAVRDLGATAIYAPAFATRLNALARRFDKLHRYPDGPEFAVFSGPQMEESSRGCRVSDPEFFFGILLCWMI